MPEKPPEKRIAGWLRFQGNACALLGSPLYAALLERAAADVEAHGPAWEILRGHEKDSRGSALALRLMGAVNRLVLDGSEPELGAVYAEPDPDPTAAWKAFSAVMERKTEALRRLVDLPVQTNGVGRCASLIHGFLAVAAETGLPLRLLEVGASAGLNLRWDSYRYRANGFSWGPAGSALSIEFERSGVSERPLPERVEIAERSGCDTAPLDPGAAEGRFTLLTYIWPDQPARLARMKAALEIAAERPVAIDHAGAAAWAGKQLARPAPGQATILFHSLVAQYLSEAELQELHGHIQRAGQEASAHAPLAWLRMEPAGELADVRLTTWPGGEDRRLARGGYHGSPVELLSAGLVD